MKTLFEVIPTTAHVLRLQEALHLKMADEQNYRPEYVEPEKLYLELRAEEVQRWWMDFQARQYRELTCTEEEILERYVKAKVRLRFLGPIEVWKEKWDRRMFCVRSTCRPRNRQVLLDEERTVRLGLAMELLERELTVMDLYKKGTRWGYMLVRGVLHECRPQQEGPDRWVNGPWRATPWTLRMVMERLAHVELKLN